MKLLPIIKCLLKPITKFRKLRRFKNMRQIKLAAGGLAVTSCFITLFLYYWYHSSTPSKRYQMNPNIQKETARRSIRITNIPMRHIPFNEIYKDDAAEEEDSMFELEERRTAYMVNTPGCQIPSVSIEYKQYVRKNPLSCGKRTVFLRKFEDDTVRVSIRPRAMKQYLRKSKNFSCCYRFIKNTSHVEHEKHKLEYTSCKRMKDGDLLTLETDFVNVKCFEYDSRNMTHIIYSDVYPFIKKLDLPNVNNTNNKGKYNVLMMGMDSMSLFRLANSMPRTINFFMDNYWLGFRGYHKVGDNTFPNLMAAFTGKNLSAITKKCSGKMDECNDLLIWSKFKESGYVTGYGEDYLRLPDTFNKNFAFRKPPTDHYLRPFFQQGEIEKNNQSLVCAGKQPSGQHLLDYAVDFATTYRSSLFFGVFWMNSFSHNVHSHPEDADKMFENFFNQLTYTGILENTFVIFFSDHGIRFGEYRLQLESFFEERMPAFIMWVPQRFKGAQPYHYRTAGENQFMLVTPYDLYNTLISIHGISNGVNYTDEYSEACPKCVSLFDDINLNRTCKDVGIHQKWCSCHKLYPLDIEDTAGRKSVIHVVSHIKSMVKNVKTDRCWGCMSLALKTILRIHFYYDQPTMTLYYVVAFSMTPGNVSYEAMVSRRNGSMELVGGVSVISVYRGLGKCTLQPRDRLFCVCQRKENC